MESATLPRNSLRGKTWPTAPKFSTARFCCSTICSTANNSANCEAGKLTCPQTTQLCFPNAVERTHRSDPDRACTVSGDDIAGIVHTQINARESDQSDEYRCARPDTPFGPASMRTCRENHGKHAIETERTHGMPARKTICGWSGSKIRNRPGAMECQLQCDVERSHANHRYRQQRRRMGLAEVEKGGDRQNTQCGHHRDGPKE